ncbi:MAG: hypothetical protein JO207_07695 [Verrucomicrobia bacterium]|nr:hypothetical protein [Verrucomicrobiota bacterium]
MDKVRILHFSLLCSCICLNAIAEPANPSAVTDLVHRADPQANVEYCGSVSTNHVDYYAFVMTHRELSGIVLAQHPAGKAPTIADADTSIFPVGDDPQRFVARPVLETIKELLRRRNLKSNRRVRQATPAQLLEISAVGRDIDQVVYPVSGFRLQSDSTREILRVLRTGSAVSVDPKTAPPGSIIVSPTQFSGSGPIFLGHAGILGWDRSIYSADARYEGRFTKNFTLTGWLTRFSGTNGTYAFVIRARLGGQAPAP